MTKAQRERVRRHAAMVAIAPSTMPPIDTEADRLQGLRQWRGDEGEGGILRPMSSPRNTTNIKLPSICPEY